MNRNKECEGNKELKNYTLLARVKKAMLANWVVKYSFYISGFFICLFLTFFPRHFEKYPEEWSQGLIVFWLSFQRLIFVIGLTFILMHSLIISKDFIARFLAWTPFGVISNISFCAYLIHYFIIERSFMGSRQTIFYGLESVMYMLFADILLTLFFAALLSVFVEQSFINLEKFFKGEKKKPVEAAGKKEGFLSDKENQATEDKKRTVNTIN